MKLKRALLWLFILLETPLQAWFCYRWTIQYGFWGGIYRWLHGAFEDPIQAATVVDFVLFIAWVGIWILEDYPRDRSKRSPFFLAWCFLYLVWPSLGVMTYLLFIQTPRPKSQAPAATEPSR